MDSFRYQKEVRALELDSIGGIKFLYKLSRVVEDEHELTKVPSRIRALIWNFSRDGLWFGLRSLEYIKDSMMSYLLCIYPCLKEPSLPRLMCTEFVTIFGPNLKFLVIADCDILKKFELSTIKLVSFSVQHFICYNLDSDKIRECARFIIV
ncbi:hypothetical protein ACH5RR_033172 [Cinchona calisaya]|uniref:Uncharacterized protein n=1 Tax=Cinchona calisaya TaxID=153742 RepID=A0ABD2YP91_9GENT